MSKTWRYLYKNFYIFPMILGTMLYCSTPDNSPLPSRLSPSPQSTPQSTLTSISTTASVFYTFSYILPPQCVYLNALLHIILNYTPSPYVFVQLIYQINHHHIFIFSICKETRHITQKIHEKALF